MGWRRDLASHRPLLQSRMNLVDGPPATPQAPVRTEQRSLGSQDLPSVPIQVGFCARHPDQGHITDPDPGTDLTTLSPHSHRQASLPLLVRNVYSLQVYSPTCTQPKCTAPHVLSPTCTQPHVYSAQVYSPTCTQPHVYSAQVYSPTCTQPHVYSAQVYSPTCTQPHVYSPKCKSKVNQLRLTLCDPLDYTVHGILQAIILEWVAFPFFRGSSQPRDQTRISCITGRFFTS